MFSAVLVIAGGIVLYFAIWRIVRREEIKVGKIAPWKRKRSTGMDGRNASPRDSAEAPALDRLKPETLADIERSLAAELGAEVHIQSVRVHSAGETSVRLWSRDGLLMVQHSHELPLLRTRVNALPAAGGRNGSGANRETKRPAA